MDSILYSCHLLLRIPAVCFFWHIFHHNKEVMTIPVAYEKTLKHIYVSVSEDIYVINSGEIVIYVNTSNEYNV
jgi:hypothetical protein